MNNEFLDGELKNWCVLFASSYPTPEKQNPHRPRLTLLGWSNFVNLDSPCSVGLALLPLVLFCSVGWELF